MTNEDKIAKLEAEVAELKASITPTASYPTDAEAARHKDAVHQMSERRASAFNPFTRDQLAAMRAAAPNDVVRGIVADNRGPQGPTSIAPRTASENLRGPVNTSGWRADTPIRPPPGINYVDAQLDAQDRRDRADAERAEAMRELRR